MSESYFVEFGRRAMATEFAILVPAEDQATPGLADTALSALDEIERLERELSVYVPLSDISRLNKLAGGDAVRLNRDPFLVLQQACQYSDQTGGAFDVTAGRLIEAWGFSKRSGRRPPDDVLQQARDSVGFRGLHLDEANRSARLEHPHALVNLGAIGKGYAIDFVAQRLRAMGVRNFLVHGGRSSILAWGDEHPGSGEGWNVAVEHPLLTGVRLGGLRLRNSAIGTSGSGKQFFHHRGKRLGHVIDPRSGFPAGDLLSLTLIAPSASQADAVATGLFVMGKDAAVDWVSAANDNVGTRSFGIVAVAPTARQADVQIAVSGLATESWTETPVPYSTDRLT